MSEADKVVGDDQKTGNRIASVEAWVSTVAVRSGRALFGDRVGIAVFLGALLWCGALWRIGIFITDTLTVANALFNVADGHLAIRQSPYSLTIGSQPGIVQVGDQVFGRNYGHVLLAVPLVWLLEGLSALADPHLLIAGGWSLLLVAFAGQVQRVTGRSGVLTAGSAVALVLFAANVWFATPVPTVLLALVALQLSTILLAALLATTLYRLLARFHGQRVGVVGGAAVLLATPIGFWASIPKRHLVTATAAVVVLYCFAVSREGTARQHLAARALSYAVLGLLTTVHPFEAFFLFVVLVPVDLLTAPSNSPRTLGLVGAVFALSVLPFFVLNTLISGNPLQAPRFLSGYGTFEFSDQAGGSGGGGSASGPESGGSSGAGSGTGGGRSTGGEGGGGDSGGGGPVGIVADLLATVAGLLAAVGAQVVQTVESVVWSAVGFAGRMVGFAGSVTESGVGWVEDGLAVLSEPDRLYHTFIRSGQLPGTSLEINDFEAVELALLESFPLAAAFVWLPVSVGQRFRAAVDGSALGTPARQTDLLAGGFAVVFTLVYLPRLPLVSQITVRYILPVFPLLLYGVVRLSAVHGTIERVPRWLVGSYLVTVVAGGVVLAAALTVLDPAIGEAMQLHALVGLAAAGLAVLALSLWPVHEDRRVVAVGLALPTGATTLFLLFSRIEYFGYDVPNTNVGTELYALDVVRVLAELLPVFPV